MTTKSFGKKIIDIASYQARYEDICRKFQEIDRLSAASAAVGKAEPATSEEWFQRGFDSQEEAAYEDAYLAHHQEIVVFMQEALNDLRQISELFDEWNTEIDENNLVIEQITPVMIDYIDKKITDGQISSVKDIIALFETGEMKGLITADDTIDTEAVAAFEKKYLKQTKTPKQFEDEEDIF